jgi:hypothetical protein
MRDECGHGNLKRQCELCEFDEQLAGVVAERDAALLKLGSYLKLIEEIHDDLLQRSTVGREGEQVVNLSHSLWCRLCDAAEDPQ